IHFVTEKKASGAERRQPRVLRVRLQGDRVTARSGRAVERRRRRKAREAAHLQEPHLRRERVCPWAFSESLVRGIVTVRPRRTAARCAERIEPARAAARLYSRRYN